MKKSFTLRFVANIPHLSTNGNWDHAGIKLNLNKTKLYFLENLKDTNFNIGECWRD